MGMQKITHKKNDNDVTIYVDDVAFAQYVKDGDAHKITFKDKEIDMESNIVTKVHGYVNKLSHTNIWTK